jgi:hypothetical protein
MLRIDHTDPKRIGYCYWQVGDYKTISKFAALERAGGDISKVKFYWMDDTWDRMDMTKEPTLTWDELLRIRAWQLRDRYQHVALLYSGGWDSSTVLMTFVKNKIPLDEIILFDRSSYVEDVELNDAYLTAKKIIEDNNLDTKLTVYEIPWDHHANIYKQAGEDFIYLPGMPIMFNQTGRLVHHTAMPSFLKIKNQHAEGTAVFIEAHDKPRVLLRDNKWYHFYVDSAMYSHIGRGGPELFYHTPDLPELELKQTYMSIRFFEHVLKTVPDATQNIVHEIQSFKHPDLYVEWNRWMGRVCSENQSALYGLSKHATVQSPNRAEMARLLNFTKEYVDDVYNIFERGLNRVKDLSGYDVLKDQLPSLISKQHYIKDLG